MKQVKKITIEAGLSPQEEALAIAQELMKKQIGSSEPKAIGKDSPQIEFSETTIVVKRRRKGKASKLCSCSVCKSDFLKESGVPLWTNYGGARRQVLYCSKSCAGKAEKLLGGRVSSDKSKVAPLVRLW